MKKRSCRRTKEEREIHEQAIRIRKMTDEQLVAHIDNEKQANYDLGYRDGLLKGREGAGAENINDFLDSIESLQGIGAVTVNKLREAAESYGYI